MTEQELLDKLSDADREVQEAKRALLEAKKRWTDAETALIGATIHRDRVQEALRVHRNTTPKKELSPNKKEVEAFRQKFPELCAEALARDLAKTGKS